MMGYFKPLRRKIGVATLGLACVLAVGWLRSAYVQDSLRLTIAGKHYVFASNLGALYWWNVEVATLDHLGPRPIRSHAIQQSVSRQEAIRRNAIELRTNPVNPPFVSFVFDLGISGSIQERKLLYWHIVIPLTLLSAWLLLSRPRAGKIEPIVAKPATDSLSWCHSP